MSLDLSRQLTASHRACLQPTLTGATMAPPLARRLATTLTASCGKDQGCLRVLLLADTATRRLSWAPLFGKWPLLIVLVHVCLLQPRPCRP
jgi:hypothetical protein